MSILITLFALGIVIFIHELGHMVAARKAGIGVYEFAVGMGPTLVSKKVGDTVYSLRAFPFGGFVKLAGLDDGEEGCPPELSFKNKSIFHRFMTLSAGALMNILSGFVIFVVIFTLIGVPTTISTIDKVFPDSPAERAGLQAGDVIVQIDEKVVGNVEKTIIPVIQNALGRSLRVVIEREGQMRTIDLSPVAKDGTELGVIGVQFVTITAKHNPLTAILMGGKKTWESVDQVFWSLGMLIRGEAGWKDMAGPIGIIQLGSHQLEQGILYFFNMMALISISLGVINLFPFPVLDGGHLVFLAYEAVLGKPVNAKWERTLTYAGGAILISLMAFVIFNDVVNWQYRVEFLQGIDGP